MDFVDVSDNGDPSGFDLAVGASFFANLSPDIPTSRDDEPATVDISETAANVGSEMEDGQTVDTSEQDEVGDFMLDDYKILGQLRPQDCYVIQKLRNGVIVPTWQMPGKPGRQLGSVLKVSGDTAAEYTENLERAGESCFPESSTNRALEVIY